MDNKLSVSKDAVRTFGNLDDGVIGIPARTFDGHIIETSCFYGKTRPKPIVVISSQAGCPMSCSFCELGVERFGRDLSGLEMLDQVRLMQEETAKEGLDLRQTPFKLTVANSGEPLFNPRLVLGLFMIGFEVHPASFKVSTVYPKSEQAALNLERLALFASGKSTPIQLQISLISTSEEARSKMTGGHAVGFKAIREAGEMWRSMVPRGRKVNLSLIVTRDMPCDPRDVVSMFPPDLFHFRFREYVPTRNGKEHALSIVYAAKLARIKSEFAAEGYEVGDWGSPSPIERRFGLASNVIRQNYMDMLRQKP